MSKELEEAKQEVKALNFFLVGKAKEQYEKPIEIVLDYIENSIPKQIVEERQHELQKEYEEALEENSTKAFILKCKLEMIKELLEGK